MKWDSEQYLKFQNERTQPAIDLVSRITLDSPQKIIDIGCGPGNSTEILKIRYPEADVLGIDNSENMIEKARNTHPAIDFRLCDISGSLDGLGGNYDIVFSNACLQWVPDHPAILKKLYDLLRPSGVLAVQIPKNWDSPLYRAMDEVISDPKWNFEHLDIAYNASLAQEEYFDILSSLTSRFSLWETIYYHRMPSHPALVEWVKGTKLKPYLNVLDEAMQQQLMDEIVQKIRPLYPVQANGEIIYQFRRLFFMAWK